MLHGQREAGEEDKSETSSEVEDEDEGEGVQAAQGYNASDYANLQVSYPNPKPLLQGERLRQPPGVAPKPKS